MVRVLLVAPFFPDLAGAAEEVYAIERSTGLVVDRLPPDARRRELVQALGDRCHDVLWFATHGQPDGVLLSEGDLLGVGDLVGMVRSAGLFGVVLNSCESEELAESLHDATGVDVVCSVTQTPDVSAFQMGSLFARHLGELQDFRAAFDAARPGGAPTFRYVPEYRESLVMAPDRYSFSNDELRTIYDAINNIGQRPSVAEVELRYVRQDLNATRQDLNATKNDLRSPGQWWIVAGGLVLSLTVAGLLFFAMRGHL